MNGIYEEFDNENGLRSYPFASGCLPSGPGTVAADVFVDAMIYPVNPKGTVYLSSVDGAGNFVVSDDSGAIMSGKRDGASVELYDLSKAKRHCGTIIASSDDALKSFVEGAESRKYSMSEAAFASSCVFPIIIDGVTSVTVGESYVPSGDFSFANGASDDIRVSSSRVDGNDTLRFDVLSNPGTSDRTSIKRIICVVDGATPFRISKLAYNVVEVRLNGISREDVCSSVHREDSFEMADTCECEKPPMPSEADPSDAYQLVEVYIPPDETPGKVNGGESDGANNAFFLVSPNELGYSNPVSITLEEESVSPDTDGIDVEMAGMSAEVADGELIDNVSSGSVVIQVPGLSGGVQ